MCKNEKISIITIEQTEQLTFFKLPKSLIKNKQFKSLSNDAKLLYTLMLDRTYLSAKNGWYDNENRVYIYYTMHEIMEDLNCSNPTCTKILSELDSKKGVGLIERKKQGQGKPDKIYVKYLVASDIEQDEINKNEKQTNFVSKSKENDSQENKKFCTNKTNKSNTKKSKNESIYPSEQEIRLDRMDEYKAFIRENIGYDHFVKHGNWREKELVEELYELICDVVCVPKKYIRIGGENIAYEIVKSQFLQLNQSHIEYVLENLGQNTNRIANIKSYLLTTLYNARFTMNHYYYQQVQCDMYG